jgi:hypothetical protein
MSEKINSFTKGLQDQLNDIDGRLVSVKKTVESASGETQVAIEAKLESVKASLEAKQHDFKTYRKKLKDLAEGKEAEVKSKVEEWKAKREVKKLDRRANHAEDYAATEVAVAVAAMDEAEQSILEAIAARLDADHAVAAK